MPTGTDVLIIKMQWAKLMMGSRRDFRIDPNLGIYY